jgi:hypothetical protein
MRRSTVHESQTRLNQAKFLLVLLVLKFTKKKKKKKNQGFQASTPHKIGKVRLQTLSALTFSTLDLAQAMQY